MSEMKLSEAIRLGAMDRPQCVRVMTDGHAVCAMGSALVALGRLDLGNQEPAYDFLKARFPVLTRVVASPLGGDVRNVISQIIVLNDDAGWTREAIANWVETIEDAQAPVVGCEDEAAMEPVLALPSASAEIKTR